MKIIIMDNYEKKIMTGEEVITAFNGIAVWFGNRIVVDGYEKEDIHQICLLEIYRAYIQYEYREKIKFSTLAICYCRNRMKRLIRDSNTQKRLNPEGKDYSLNRPYDEDGSTLLDILGYNDRIEDNILSKIFCKEIVEQITEDETKLIPVLLGVKSMEQLGREMGMSKVAIHKRAKKFKERIREAYLIS